MTVTKKVAGWRPEAPNEYGAGSSIFASFNMVQFWLYWQSFWPWLAAKSKHSFSVEGIVEGKYIVKNVYFILVRFLFF